MLCLAGRAGLSPVSGDVTMALTFTHLDAQLVLTTHIVTQQGASFEFGELGSF